MRVAIDAQLRLLLPLPHDADDRVGIAMHEGVLAPGKRTRPLLMLLVGRGVGSESKALIDLACAVEMVHAASLFLDDMPCMDNAWMRRGRPAIHARFGQDVAMLAAVALLSQACATVASAPDLPGTLRSQLVQVLCEAVGARGLVRGQFRDLHEGRATRPASSIASTNEQKTGVLFAAALDMAALASAAPDEARQALRAAAIELGQAFQLRDDLEDACDEPGDRLKDSHRDDGKSTLVAVLGRDAVRRRLDVHLAQACEHLREAFRGNEGVVGLMLEAFGLVLHETDALALNRTPVRYARAAGQPVVLGVVR
jgi:geranylgeranyl diphosphate synthase, type II